MFFFPVFIRGPLSCTVVHLISNSKLGELTGMKMGTKVIMGITVC